MLEFIKNLDFKMMVLLGVTAFLLLLLIILVIAFVGNKRKLKREMQRESASNKTEITPEVPRISDLPPKVAKAEVLPPILPPDPKPVPPSVVDDPTLPEIAPPEPTGYGDEVKSASLYNGPYDEEATVLLPQPKPVYKLTLTSTVDSTHSVSYAFLEKDSCIIGRSKNGTDIMITGEAEISNRHCKVDKTPEGFFITDLNSTNGTFVNDKKIDGATKVVTGTVLRLGRADFNIEISRV